MNKSTLSISIVLFGAIFFVAILLSPAPATAVSHLAVPVLFDPDDGDIVADLTPTLNWSFVPGAAEFNVGVFGPGYSKGFFTGGPDIFTIPFGELTNGDTYTWQVFACAILECIPGSEGPSSVIRSFTVNTTAPGAPTNASPPDLGTSPETTTTSWDAPSGDIVANYHWEYRIKGGFTLSSTFPTSTSYTIPTVLTVGTTYEWRVQACGATSGGCSLPGPYLGSLGWNEFTVTGANAPPTITFYEHFEDGTSNPPTVDPLNSVFYNADATDPDGLTDLDFCRVLENGTEEDRDNTITSGDCSLRVTGHTPGDTINYVIEVTDFAGNTNTVPKTGSYTVDIPAGNDIELSGNFDYGDVDVGDTVSHTFVLEQIAPGGFWGDISVSPPFFCASVSDCHYNLSGVGNTKSIIIEFSPINPAGVFEFSIVTSPHAMNSVTLSGTGVAPPPPGGFTINPAPELDFGSITAGTSVIQTFTIVNDPASFLITVDVSLLFGSPEFEIVGGPSIFTVAPGATETIEIQFSPPPGVDAGYSGSVKIKVTDHPTLSGLWDRNLAGSGTTGGAPPPGPGVISFKNPLGDKTLTDVIEAVANFLFTIALIIAPILIVVAGIIFMTAAGDPGRISTARRMLIWTVVGFTIILLSTGLITVLKGILGAP